MILVVIGILISIEGFFVSFFPKSIKKAKLKFAKNPKKIRRVAIFELVIGILLIIIGSLIGRW